MLLHDWKKSMENFLCVLFGWNDISLRRSSCDYQKQRLENAPWLVFLLDVCRTLFFFLFLLERKPRNSVLLSKHPISDLVNFSHVKFRSIHRKFLESLFFVFRRWIPTRLVSIVIGRSIGWMNFSTFAYRLNFLLIF